MAECLSYSLPLLETIASAKQRMASSSTPAVVLDSGKMLDMQLSPTLQSLWVGTCESLCSFTAVWVLQVWSLL
jgi:hypothetical protein